MCNFYPNYFLLDIITWVTCIVSEGPQCDTPHHSIQTPDTALLVPLSSFLLIIMVELSECNIKLDHSLGCPDDAPNWRLVPGFPIYGVGQPTNDGFNKVISVSVKALNFHFSMKIIEKISDDTLVWFNTRQEPVAYVNGQPVTPRDKTNPHGNLDIGGKVEQMDQLEVNLIISRNIHTFLF